MRKRTLVPLLLLPLLAACSKDEAPQQPAQSAAPAAPAAPEPTPAPAPGPQAQAPAPAPVPGPQAQAPASEPGAPAAAGGSSAKGEDVYKQTCFACHGAGVAGAPKLGDKADWQPRIAQGEAVLYDHSIKGYSGSKGVMPPKGGNMSLSDDQVKAAVDYMVAQAK